MHTMPAAPWYFKAEICVWLQAENVCREIIVALVTLILFLESLFSSVMMMKIMMKRKKMLMCFELVGAVTRSVWSFHGPRPCCSHVCITVVSDAVHSQVSSLCRLSYTWSLPQRGNPFRNTLTFFCFTDEPGNNHLTLVHSMLYIVACCKFDAY